MLFVLAFHLQMTNLGMDHILKSLHFVLVTLLYHVHLSYSCEDKVFLNSIYYPFVDNNFKKDCKYFYDAFYLIYQKL